MFSKLDDMAKFLYAAKSLLAKDAAWKGGFAIMAGLIFGVVGFDVVVVAGVMVLVLEGLDISNFGRLDVNGNVDKSVDFCDGIQFFEDMIRDIEPCCEDKLEDNDGLMLPFFREVYGAMPNEAAEVFKKLLGPEAVAVFADVFADMVLELFKGVSVFVLVPVNMLVGDSEAVLPVACSTFSLFFTEALFILRPDVAMFPLWHVVVVEVEVEVMGVEATSIWCLMLEAEELEEFERKGLSFCCWDLAAAANFKVEFEDAEEFMESNDVEDVFDRKAILFVMLVLLGLDAESGAAEAAAAFGNR